MRLKRRRSSEAPPEIVHMIHMDRELTERNNSSPPVEFEVVDETPCPDGKGTHVWTRVYSLRVEHVDPKEDV